MPSMILFLALVTQASAKLFCEEDTGGTCGVGACKSSRGPGVYCDKDFQHKDKAKCLCKKGYCAVEGTCYSSTECQTDTGGSCKLMGCSSSRGETECISGKCMCKSGGCVLGNSGTCSYKCEKNSGGTCSLVGCKSSRGPVDCVAGKCLCKAGYCAIDGTCYPHTGKFEEVITNTTELPASWSDDAQAKAVTTSGVSLTAFAFMSAAFGVFTWSRRGLKSDLSEDLLPEQNGES